jgi:hypothetical protein
MSKTKQQLAVTTVSAVKPPPRKSEIISALVERKRREHAKTEQAWDTKEEELNADVVSAIQRAILARKEPLKLSFRVGYNNNILVEIDLPRSMPGYPTAEAKAFIEHRDKKPGNFNPDSEKERIVKGLVNERVQSILNDVSACAALDSILSRISGLSIS